MDRLTESLSKFDRKSTIESIIVGLQKETYISGLRNEEIQFFQNYLITLLRAKSDTELIDALGSNSRGLMTTVDSLNKVIKDFSVSSSNAASALNRWTMVLAFATIGLVLVTIVMIFK